jgi:cytochrome c biogenesis protein CcmG/thiol:disulfide interchange protein DsbE
MSMSEKSNDVRVDSTQWCSKCGASLQAPKQVVAEGTQACEACGAPIVPLETHFVADPTTAPPQQPVPPPRRNPFALVVVALVAAGMLYFGLHMTRRSGTDHPAGMGFGTPAPDFTLETLDGKSMSLSSLRGKAVLVNFWATWCGPCKIETPWLVELQKQYGEQGLQVVGVAMDDSGKDEISRFAQEMGMNYPVLMGKEAVGEAYGGVPALPESFFVGRDGKIVDKILGLRDRQDIEDAVKKALNTSSASTGITADPVIARQ